MRRIIYTAFFLSAMIVLAGCGEKIKPGEHRIIRPEVRGVGIEEVTLTSATDYYEVSGTVRAKNTSYVSAKVMGVVRDIKAGPADRVAKGDVLLLIDSPDVEAKAAAAAEAYGEAVKGLDMSEENKNLMDKTYERFKRLYEEKALSEQEFDEIRTKREIAVLQYERAQKTLKRAEAALSEAKALRAYTVISSPVDGIVAEKKIDVGSMTAPGAPLFTIEEPVYRVEAAVDEGLLSSIKIKGMAGIHVDSLNLITDGKVGEIDHQVDPVTRTVKIKVDFKNGVSALRGGLFARIKFPMGEKLKLFVGNSAIVTRGELKGVYVVDKDDIVTLRLVKTGKERDGMVEILSGLSEGERIIVRGVDKAVDGGMVVKGTGAVHEE